MIVVSNSSPLIALAQIGEFELYEELWIPDAVREEVARIGSDSEKIEKNRPGIEEVRGATWIRSVNVSNLEAVQILRGRLDAGESEAIVLAQELNADLLLIDEARGQKSR
jgi:predicted nucleic acid-binding protein